ncbi:MULTISPECIES: DUF1266 domain-containing protein [unclassified Paenibacillus]|uniref:DUF1266 domain-containing protein n=1 Tax=unclassified Paenibacillus TaxID=185978 RepID=UPI0008C5DD7A|nr:MULTISPECIES: DUF1266 domain-containing protein [unclassified Paenibacillus]QLG38243.1 DUF1266 domain-containing protein [Paenibacillus sp. E222]SEO67853.1 Protein of unknown function [Paenibacillus sp. OK076]
MRGHHATESSSIHRVTDKELWFRGMAAILNEIIDLDINNDYEYHADEEQREKFCTKLEENWEIHDRKSLMSSLDWIRNEGYRISFDEKRTFLSTMSEKDQGNYMNSLDPDTGKYHEYLVVKTYMHKLPAEGVAAWDWGCYANLCRQSAHVGYITETESEQLVLQAALDAQSAYTSWKAYTVAFMAGRLYWLEKTDESVVKRQMNYLQNLFVHPNSIYKKIDWNLSLQ